MRPVYFLSSKHWLFIGLMLGLVQASTAQKAVVRETTQTLKTYPFSDPDPVPKPGRIYPYFRYDGYTDKPIMKEWKFIELENDYIKVYITPEIGGKIWGAYEKSTNYPFIYFNHAVKFRDVAMRGAWTSGGIEINFGDIGHAPTVSTPVDYYTRTNADGSVSCFLGAWDWSARTRWMVEVNLPKDKAYFTTKSHWYNATPFETSYYHWMNAGFKAAGNLEFVFPGTHYIGHEGEVGTWPKDSLGRNLNFYNQNNFGSYKSYHVLGKKTDFFGGFWHDDNMGFVRYSPYYEKLGKKVWVWGLSRQGMIWEKLLTDDDGQYVELQSGRLFNQAAEGSMYSPFKHVSFMPYTHDSWTEYWYPVKNTRGLTHATPQGAVNLRVQDGWLKLDYCAVSFVQDTLMIGFDSKLLVAKKLDLKPLEVVRDSVRWTGDTEKLSIRLGNEIISDGKSLVTERPLKNPKSFNWDSEYGLFLKAKDLMNQRKYVEADTVLQKLLKKNSSYTPALTLFAELSFLVGLEDASQLLTDFSLAYNTYDSKANFIAGISNAHFDRMSVAKDRLATAALDPVYRSAALYHLAKIAVKEKNYSQALTLVEQSLESQNENWNAKQLEIIVLRLLNLNARALLKAKEVLSKDPLNHFARFEIVQITKNDVDGQEFTRMIRGELPVETYLEIAINYVDLGLYEAGLEVLKEAPQNPIVSLWRSYLYDKMNLKNESESSLNEVISMSCEGVFPFRNETASVLKWAIQQKQHWKLLYYRHLTTASYRSEKYGIVDFGLIDSPKFQPDFVPYYLYKADVSKQDKATAKASLERAHELEPQNWRVVKALSDFYASNGQLKKGLDVNESRLPKLSKIPESGLPDHEVYILGQQRAQLLLKLGRYKECIDWMKSLTILPNEGASGAHALFREANIRYAAELTKNKKYKEAQPYLDQAETWPENLGSGAPYDPDNHLTAFLKKYITRKMKNQQVDMADVLKLSKELPKADFELLKSLPIELGDN
jgi:hypothetical protein